MLYILETRKFLSYVFLQKVVSSQRSFRRIAERKKSHSMLVCSTTSEKKMNFIMKRCPSANIQLKRASTAKLNTLGGSGSGKAKSKKSSEKPIKYAAVARN